MFDLGVNNKFKLQSITYLEAKKWVKMFSNLGYTTKIVKHIPRKIAYR